MKFILYKIETIVSIFPPFSSPDIMDFDAAQIPAMTELAKVTLIKLKDALFERRGTNAATI